MQSEIIKYICGAMAVCILIILIASRNKDNAQPCTYDRATINLSEVKNLQGNRKLESVMFNLGDKTYKITAEELNKYEEK